MKVKVTYWQRFWGEDLEDSYEEYIDDITEIYDIERALYSDDNVYRVHVEVIEDE